MPGRGGGPRPGMRHRPGPAGLPEPRREDHRDRDLAAGEHRTGEAPRRTAHQHGWPRRRRACLPRHPQETEHPAGGAGQLRRHRDGPPRCPQQHTGDLWVVPHRASDQHPAVRPEPGRRHERGPARRRCRREMRYLGHLRAPAVHDHRQHRARHGPGARGARRAEGELLRHLVRHLSRLGVHVAVPRAQRPVPDRQRDRPRRLGRFLLALVRPGRRRPLPGLREVRRRQTRIRPGPDSRRK